MTLQLWTLFDGSSFPQVGTEDQIRQCLNKKRTCLILGMSNGGFRLRLGSLAMAYPLGRPAYPLKIAVYPERK